MGLHASWWILRFVDLSILECDCERFIRLKPYVDENIGEPLSIAAMAGVVALSPFHFARKFKRCTAVTPMQYVMQRRVFAAMAMLIEAPWTNAQIAYRCGFASESHFCTAFKAMMGQTPTAWRTENRP